MRSLALALILAVGCGSSSAVAPRPVEAHASAPPADPEASVTFDEAARVLAAVGSDCAAACRALGQMRSSRLRLCAPRTAACDDAEHRERDARAHVASFCECPP
jgi:hypothetical protein